MESDPMYHATLPAKDLVSYWGDIAFAIMFTLWFFEWVEDRVKKFLARRKLKDAAAKLFSATPKEFGEAAVLAALVRRLARMERGTISEMPTVEPGSIYENPIIERFRQIDHEGHGAASEDGQPLDPDCPCRGTALQAECARVADCSFCKGHGA